MAHFYKSWGRTRQPKNLAGPPAAQAKPKNAAPGGNAAKDIDGSYSTENQRFLHLLLESTDAGRPRNVVVYGFSHAMGRWAPLFDTSGNAITTGNVTDTSAYKVFEIHGVDKVYFFSTTDGSTAVVFNELDFFFAAGSTF